MEELRLEEPLESGMNSHKEGRRIEAALGRGEIQDGVFVDKSSASFREAAQKSEQEVRRAEEELAALKTKMVKGEQGLEQRVAAAEANLEVLRAKHQKQYLH